MLAKYSEDENWYRAVVIETDAENVKVRFADFGNAEKIPISTAHERLKVLNDKEFLELPGLAFPISLNGNFECHKISVERVFYRFGM